MVSDKKSSSDHVLSTVNFLRGLDLSALPISRNSKVTYCKNFTDPNFSTPWNDWEKQDLGVGLLLSARYKLIDIDLDYPGIENLAVAHLPQNGWIFGRKSKKGSHHVFVIENETDTTQQERASDPANKGYMDTEKIISIEKNPKDRQCIIEYRGDGAQTVMPGTVHPSGERVTWKDDKQPDGLPAAVKSTDLRRAVRKIAFTVMAANHGWFDGSKHDLSLCYAGMFCVAKWSLEEAEHWMSCFLDYVAEGDDKRKVLRAVRDTYKSHEKGNRVVGGPRLAEITQHQPLVTAFRRMFMDQREAIFEDMNARYALGVYFGKLQVFDFNIVDDMSLPDFETMSVSDFEVLTSNERVKVPGKKGDMFVPKSKFWIGHPERRTYRVTDFIPGGEKEVDGKLNLWRGWAVQPSSRGSIEHWLDHVDRFICGGNQEMKHWLLAWLADIVQNPCEKPGTAVLMRSGQRSGKNTFVEMMKRVIGRRYVREMNSSAQVSNRFNSHLQYALLVMANEADFSTSHAATNVLKTLITDKDFHMDHKHGHAKTGRNFTRVVLASNKIHVIDRDQDDQRYTVIDVVNPNHEMEAEQRARHFDRIYAEINGDGPPRLLDFLGSYAYDRDLLRTCFQSDAGRAQILMSMNPVAQWWSRCLSDGRVNVPDMYLDRVEYYEGGGDRLA